MPGLSKISIDQQLAAIGIETTPAKMHITMSQLMLKVDVQNASMEIERKGPTFRINRKKLNSDSGLKLPAEMIKEFSNKGKGAAFKAMRRIASDGNYLAETRRRGNRVAQLSRSKALQVAKKETNIGLLPKNRAELIWDPGYLKVNWRKHKVSIDWEGEYLPQITIDPPYSIEVYLRNKPYFRITVTEGENPYQPGQHVDKLL